MFLIDCDRGIIRTSTVRIIFQLLFSIIEEKQMASHDSQDIYICNKDLQQLVGMPHIHLSQLRNKILGMLRLSNSGRVVNNPTDSYKIMIRRLFPQQPSSSGEQRNNQIPVQPVQPQRILWTMSRDLSSLLIGFVSETPVEFRSGLSTMGGDGGGPTPSKGCTPPWRPVPPPSLP